jgi:hypothetical protein
MRVDQTRHNYAPAAVDHTRAFRGAGIFGRNCPDATIIDDEVKPFPQGRRSAVEEAEIRQQNRTWPLWHGLCLRPSRNAKCCDRGACAGKQSTPRKLAVDLARQPLNFRPMAKATPAASGSSGFG